jgi:hypothetical protein
MALPEQSKNLLQALSTWRNCWKKAVENVPSDHQHWLGVAKNAPGIEYLSRRVIEVAVSTELGRSQYLQRITSHSRKELHEFIREFVSKPADADTFASHGKTSN